VEVNREFAPPLGEQKADSVRLMPMSLPQQIQAVLLTDGEARQAHAVQTETVTLIF